MTYTGLSTHVKADKAAEALSHWIVKASEVAASPLYVTFYSKGGGLPKLKTPGLPPGHAVQPGSSRIQRILQNWTKPRIIIGKLSKLRSKYIGHDG